MILFLPLFLFIVITTGCNTSSGSKQLTPILTEEQKTTTASKESTATIATIAPKALPYDINRFDEAIAAFQKEDQSEGIEKGEILFIGSSSIRFWTTLEEDMAGLEVKNRGFGGSTLPEVVHYADKILFPYAPKTIVLYCGENDISEGRTPQEALESFQQLIAQIVDKLPETKVFYLCMKPSVARWELWNQMETANRLFQEFIETQENVAYVDISAPMLDEKGMPRKEIFVEDMLHMNEKGYAAWTEIVRGVLE